MRMPQNNPQSSTSKIGLSAGENSTFEKPILTVETKMVTSNSREAFGGLEDKKFKEKEPQVSLNSEESGGVFSNLAGLSNRDPNLLVKSQIRAHLEEHRLSERAEKTDSQLLTFYGSKPRHPIHEEQHEPVSRGHTPIAKSYELKTTSNHKKSTSKNSQPLFPSKAVSPPRSFTSPNQFSTDKSRENITASKAELSKIKTTGANTVSSKYKDTGMVKADLSAHSRRPRPLVKTSDHPRREKKIEDHLMDKAKALQQKKKVMREREYQINASHKPEISEYSKRLPRQGKVHDR